MKVVDLFNLIKNTPGSNDKKILLDQHMNPTIKQIFDDAYGSQKYYVKKYDVKTDSVLTIDNDYSIFHNMLQDLSSRKVTGNAAVALVEETIGMYRLEEQWLLHCIMERNLKIGISLDNFSKVSGESSKFEVALAHNLDKTKNVNPIDGTYFASRKLDGCRTICQINNYYEDGELIQDVKFLSRTGKEFTTLSNLIDPIKSFIKEEGEGVLDGECCIMEGENENFNLLMREVTRKNHTIENPRYNIFDILTLNEFNGLSISPSFEIRYNKLKMLYTQCKSPSLSILNQERITTQEDFDRWTGYVSENQWEGFMLRKDVPYKSGRSKDLLKVKKFLDAEYIIEDVVTGKVSYNENGMKEYDAVTALIIDHKGTKVQVGSGLSKEQRLNWFNNPGDIIGKTATIQYFEESINKKDNSLSLRFPVLKHVYENGRNV